jgi:hypothetical protein
MKTRSTNSSAAMKRRLGAIIGAGALVAMLVPSAFADTTWATVTGYAPGTAENNNPATWGNDCTKTADGANLGDTYVLDKDYDLVIVKAGSEESAPGHVNTLFANASAGETVWADSNGSGAFDEGDKGISHIIFCGPHETATPTPTLPEETPGATPTPTLPEETPGATPTPTLPEETPVVTPAVTPVATPAQTPGGSVGGETATPQVTPGGSEGAVEGETDVPTAPSTDIDGTAGPTGSSMPILLIVLGIIGLAAVVLTPARRRR